MKLNKGSSKEKTVVCEALNLKRHVELPYLGSLVGHDKEVRPTVVVQQTEVKLNVTKHAWYLAILWQLRKNHLENEMKHEIQRGGIWWDFMEA